MQENDKKIVMTLSTVGNRISANSRIHGSSTSKCPLSISFDFPQGTTTSTIDMTAQSIKQA